MYILQIFDYIVSKYENKYALESFILLPLTRVCIHSIENFKAIRVKSTENNNNNNNNNVCSVYCIQVLKTIKLKTAANKTVFFWRILFDSFLLCLNQVRLS